MAEPLVLLTRPREQSERFARVLSEDGWRALIWPVIEIAPKLVAAPDYRDAEALIFTSARAIEALARFGTPPLPAFCVGPATAQAAREAGFRDVREAGGDAAALVRMLAGAPRRLLHIRGREVACDLAAALRGSGGLLRELVAYAADPSGPPPPEVDEAMRAGPVSAVAFFSPRTARLFAETAPESWRGAYPRMSAAAISPAACAPLAPLGFARVKSARSPDSEALRALLKALRPAP